MDIYLVEPRGFCGGVKRAISLVEQTLQKYGAPVYVRHEIVHNRHVIEGLKKQGVIFIENIDEINDCTRPLIFSAHGVSKEVCRQAAAKGLNVVDATCPLVAAVHKKIVRLAKEGAEIIVIGKASHPEIQGTVGQTDEQQHIHIVSSLEEARNLSLPKNANIGVVTQTTLSVDDTKDILEYLNQRFPNLNGLKESNVCFATTNRQQAVKELIRYTPNIIVLGSENSSNSTQLRNSALKNGAAKAVLTDDWRKLDKDWLAGCDSVGVTAGASAPEYLVQDLLEFLRQNYDNVNIHNVIIAKEEIDFK